LVKAPAQNGKTSETAGKSPGGRKDNVVSARGGNSAFPVIRPKLSVDDTTDLYEKEADQMADAVMENSGARPSPAASSPPETPASGSSSPAMPYGLPGPSSARKPARSGAAISSLPRAIAPSGPMLAPSGPIRQKDISGETLSGISRSRGRGASLDPGSGALMEENFGTDFSQVNIHQGAEAAEMNRALGSRAFTVGNDVYFNAGEYRPGTEAGTHLLAHELTHVVQQGNSQEKSVADSPVRIQRSVGSTLRSWGRSAANLASGAARGVVSAGSAVVGAVTEGLAAARDYLLNLVREFVSSIPGYRAFCVILGRDPVTGELVERNGRNFIEAGLDIIPGGNLLKEKLESKGIMSTASVWLDGLIREFSANISEVRERIIHLINNVSVGSVRETFSGIRQIIMSAISAVARFAANVAVGLLRIIKDFVISELIDFIKDQTSAYPLLTLILGKDPVSGETVERTPLNLFMAVMHLSEEGREQLRQMEESGALDKAITWVDGAVERLDINAETIRNGFRNAWELLTIENLMRPRETFRELYSIFAPPVRRIFNFIIEVALKVIQFIKDALLSRLSVYAQRVPGYNLMRVILGRDPFTAENVPRSLENIILGFMTLIPGGEEKFNELKESGAIERMGAWLDGALERLNITWEYVAGLFSEIWNSFRLSDLASPLEAFRRVVDFLAAPVTRFVAFLYEVIKKIVEVVLIIMNFPVDLIRQIVANAMQAYEDIRRDPLAFFRNLLRAVRQGFTQFFGNIARHLVGGLTGWLFGELREAGVQPPADFSFRSVFAFIIEVLGITRKRIFDKIAEKIGPERMEKIRAFAGRLEGIWTFVTDVVTRGPVAIWERIQQKLSNLWDMVLEKIRSWVVVNIIREVTKKLMSMLDPSGIMAVINSFIAFYRSVQTFIQRLREILQVINSFVLGVAEIARGTIAKAADFLENAMGNAMPVVISFLANQVGLGGIGRKIGQIIEAIREKVDIAIEWLIDRAISAGSALLEMGKSAAAGIAGWWNARKVFRADTGEQHTLYFDGEEENAELMIASAPKKFIDHINSIDRENLTGEQKAGLEEAKELDRAIYNRRREENGYDTVVELLNRLAEVSAGLLIGGRPASVIGYGPLTPEGGATFADARVLAKGTHVKGSAPSDAPPLWQNSNRRKTSQVFIRGHLLNHNIGGPGHAYNLTPITGNGAGFGNNYANKVHHDKVEKFVKDAYDDDNVVRYRIDVDYGKHPERNFQRELRRKEAEGRLQPMEEKKLEIMDYEQDNLALSFLTRWCRLEQENGEWIKELDVKEDTIENRLPDGDFELK
jgi:phage-related protein